MIPPHPKLPTNDGTYRSTVRWTAPSDVTEFENDKNRLNEALHTFMTTLFQDTDGVFYKWESEELLETEAASSLTKEMARDFVSPKVTIIGSRSMMVFGIRFGFLSSPGKWQYSERTKTTLRTAFERSNLQFEKHERRFGYRRLHFAEGPKHHPQTLLYPVPSK